MYQTPPLYMALHIVGGAISYFYPLLIWLFVAYQLLQLALGALIYYSYKK